MNDKQGARSKKSSNYGEKPYCAIIEQKNQEGFQKGKIHPVKKRTKKPRNGEQTSQRIKYDMRRKDFELKKRPGNDPWSLNCVD